jgi:uncharacterized membrane protein HdeD (DUF308 family)
MSTESSIGTEVNSSQRRGRFWFVLSGIFSIILGALAIGIPCVTTVAIAKLVGIILLAGGMALLATALVGKNSKHRLLDAIMGVLRILVGILVLGNLFKAVLFLTVLLAAVLVVEGLAAIVLAFKLRSSNPAWGWVLINALAALTLGVMLFVKFPSDSPWVVGLLFGINSVLVGVSLIMFGLGLKKPQSI